MRLPTTQAARAWAALALGLTAGAACGQQLGRYEGRTDAGDYVFLGVMQDESGQYYIGHITWSFDATCRKTGEPGGALLSWNGRLADITGAHAEAQLLLDKLYTGTRMDFIGADRVEGQIAGAVARLIGPAPPRQAQTCSSDPSGFQATWTSALLAGKAPQFAIEAQARWQPQKRRPRP